MKIVHLNLEHEKQPSKRGKLANDKQALQVGLLNWKLKHNAKLDRQQKQS